MAFLLAVLLGFLAQNFVSPWPYDFTAACVALAVLAFLLIYRKKGPSRLGWLGIVALALLAGAAWYWLPAGYLAFFYYFGAGVLFVFSVAREPATSEASAPLLERRGLQVWLEVVAVALIVLAAAIPAIVNNGSLPPGLHGDEAESGIEARNINAGKYDTLIGVGWYDQPLPSFLVQAIGLRLFGNDVSGLRTTSAIVSLASLPFLYLLTRRLFGVRVALLATVLMAFAHWFIAYAHIGINYNQTLFLELIAIYTFWEGWQTRRWYWWVFCGVVTGAGLYLYFASRLVPILLGVFAAYLVASRWVNASEPNPPKRFPIPQAIVAGIIALLMFAPMGSFFLDHAKEFNSRAAFVFLFSDTQFNTAQEKLKIYTGTTDVPTALIIQIYRYATIFNVGGDRSGQYGNSLPLIDYYTAVFFILGFGYAIYRWADPRFALLLIWLVLTLFIGGVLTIESPFTPRIIGAMPIPFILAAVALDRLWAALDRRLRAPALAATDHAFSQEKVGLRESVRARLDPVARYSVSASIVLFLCAAAYFNYWSYFEHYMNSIDGWAQREPATAIAHYAAALKPDQTLYVLSAPELFVWHGTIRFLAPNLRGYDLTEPTSELPIRDVNTQSASFVMLPNYLKYLDQLRKLYPHGRYLEFRRANGDLWYTIYEVDSAEIAARRTGR
jgi:4-amino-4-deoxy-L-arabinose transferase-like glycosyltransferase